MQRARDQLLTRPALALEQYGCVTAGHPADGLVDVLHRRSLADEAAPWRELRPYLLLEVLHHQGEPAQSQCPLDEQLDFLDVERLGEIVERAPLHRLDRVLHRALGGHDQKWHVETFVARVRQQVEAGDVGESNVDDRQVEAAGPERRERGEPLGERAHVVPTCFESALQYETDGLLVFGHEDARLAHDGAGSLSQAGSITRNSVRPGTLSTRTEPPWSEAIR